MSNRNCYNETGESNGENDTEKKYEAFMRAGELSVQAEGESSEQACEEVQELWDKAVEDISEMPEEERKKIMLQ